MIKRPHRYNAFLGRDPTANDIMFVGAKWFNYVNGTEWICTDVSGTPLSATWQQVGASGSGGGGSGFVVDIFGDGSAVGLWLLDNSPNDEGGNYNGVWFGTEQYGLGATSNSGTAGVFNGASKIEIPMPASVTGASVVSVSLWFNWGGTQTTMLCGFQTYDIFFYAGLMGFNTFNADVLGVSVPTSNAWHHAVFEFHANNVSLNKIYLNGTLQALTQAGTPNNTNAVFGNFALGTAFGQNSYYFSGSIDHVRIFTRALTSSEVQTLYTEI